MKRVILPFGGELAVWRIDGEQLEVERKLPVPKAHKWCWCEEQQHVAFIEQSGKRVSVWRLGTDAWESLIAPTYAPKKVVMRCFALKGAQFYFGNETLWVLEAPNTFHRLPTGGLEKLAEKSIDGLIVRGNRLIAVDDFVLPKWNLEFDIAAPALPKLVAARYLMANTSYEHVNNATASARLLATGSSGMNHGDVGSFVSLYDLASLCPLGSWGTWADESEVQELCFSAEVLWVLRGNGAIDRVDLRNVTLPLAPPPMLPNLIEPSTWPDEDGSTSTFISLPEFERVSTRDARRVLRLESLFDGRCATVFGDADPGFEILP